jgi:hypothetical protein
MRGQWTGGQHKCVMLQNIHRILFQKPEDKKELEIFRRRQEDTNKAGLENNSASVQIGFI